MPGEAEHRLRERLARLKNLSLLGGAKLSSELERLQRQLDQLEAEPTDEDIWRSVELARHPERPYTLDYVDRLLDDWVELHGDRGRADDGAMVAGLGSFRGRTVVLVGMQKGRDIQERTRRQFGMPYPEGYRKAMRAMELADRHGFPVISLVDTPGAYPGGAAAARGRPRRGAGRRRGALRTRARAPAAGEIPRYGRLRLNRAAVTLPNAVPVPISWDIPHSPQAFPRPRPRVFHCFNMPLD